MMNWPNITLTSEDWTAARLLKRYPTKLAKLNILREKYAELSGLSSVEAQKYGTARPSTGTYSDPVASRYATIEIVEKAIARLELEIRPVQEVYNRLKNASSELERELFLVLERHIINREDLLQIGKDLELSERTLRRRRRKLLDMVKLEARKWQE